MGQKSKSGKCRVIARFEPVVLSPEQQADQDNLKRWVTAIRFRKRQLWYATHAKHRRKR